MTDKVPHEMGVLGAGPKGLALLAKAQVLQSKGFVIPTIKLFDRNGIASHWTGSSGLTDGRQKLGTPPEKDVGFPYRSTCWYNQSGDDLNDLINAEMQKFSWQSFKIAVGEFSDWIDRGRMPPRHREWAEYLNWVAGLLNGKSKLITGDVKSIRIESNKWLIEHQDAKTKRRSTTQLESLVVTGPGEPRLIEECPKKDVRLFNGSDFWTRLEEIDPKSSVAVVGSGETAASVAIALTNRLHPDSGITIINPVGLLYSRGESFTENAMFTNPEKWRNLSEKDRRELIRRSDRGVFSIEAQHVLNFAPNVDVLGGRVKRIEFENHSAVITMEYNGRFESRSYDYVVVARGFWPLSFIELIHQSSRKAVESALGLDPSPSDRLASAEARIGEDLSVDGLTPKLYLPMLAGVAQGPGFPNLSCLGLLSDRILQRVCSSPKAVLG